MSSQPELLLYEHPVSSYVQKVKIALREKGIRFTATVPEDLSKADKNSPFATANPRAEVPALIDGDLKLFESGIILEYIEEKWPDPPLLPKDAEDRAFARLTAEVCDTQYEAINWGVGEVRWFKRASGELAEKLEAQAKHQTVVIHDWLSKRLGEKKWFNGEQFGYADLCVAPFVNRSVDYGFGPEEGSALQMWHAKVKERPSVKQTFGEYEEGAAKMPQVAEIYMKSGERKREYRDHRLDWMIKSGGVDVVTEGLRKENIRFSWPGPL